MGSTINNDSSMELVGLVTNAWTLLCGNMYEKYTGAHSIGCILLTSPA